MKKWLARLIVKTVFKGITEDDLLDLTQLTDGQYENYCFEARGLNENYVYQAELKRLRFRQERYLANKAKTTEDLIYGRAALLVIDLLEKRIKFLSDEADRISKESDPDQAVS